MVIRNGRLLKCRGHDFEAQVLKGQRRQEVETARNRSAGYRDETLQQLQNHLSASNVVGIKHFLKRGGPCAPRVRHFAPLEDMANPTNARSQLASGQEPAIDTVL